MRTHVNSVGLLIRADPALLFTYPAHIPRDCIDALPQQPGIYIFRDEAATPIYIGKSVNIRHRVLSHLRTPDEAQMLARTRHIDFERTGGELGALLREAMLIREHQPVFNVKLRQQRDMCAIALREHRPEIVFAKEVDFGRTDGLFGLFGTKKAAQETLKNVAQAANLCSVLTGLEKGSPGRPCFARQLARCRGGCTGEESLAEHGARLHAALGHMLVRRWPFDGPIAIVEESAGLKQKQLVDNWCYLGTGRLKKKRGAARFDPAVYHILQRPLLEGGLTVELL